MLGVVLHAGASGLWRQSGDSALKTTIEITIGFIHIFRMPAFFLLSGFFGALLWYRRGPGLTLKNRFRRLVLPFLGFLFILWPLLNWGLSYLTSLYSGHSEPIWRALGDAMNGSLPPRHLIHLWFLYYLIIITVIATTVVLWMERLEVAWPRVQSFVRRTFESPWRSLFILGGLNALWFALLGWDDIPTSDRWAPNMVILLYYLAFYAFGWVVYSAKIDLQNLREHAWAQVIIGAVLAGLYFGAWHLTMDASRAGDDLPKVGWYLLRSLFFGGALVAITRGLLGVFLRYANTGAYGWRYVSDSSYWVYLFHIFLCVSIPYLLALWDLPILVKYYLTMLLTMVICLVTYDLFIRSTWAGKFLNGRTYTPYSSKLSLLVMFLFCGWAAVSWSHLSERNQILQDWKRAGGSLAFVPFTESMTPWTTIDETKRAPQRLLKGCLPIGEYMLCREAAHRETARQVCAALGGDLLMLESEAENIKINELVSDITQKPFWLDLDDLAKEGQWRWQNGAALDYSGWDSSQPDSYGGNEDCAAANWGGTQRWHDVGCRAKFPFVCEAGSEGATGEIIISP